MNVRFVTSNAGKFQEAKAVLAPFGVGLVRSAQSTVEIQSDRLDEIAATKAEQLWSTVRPPYFLEDAGLFVDALGGFPGPYSAYTFKTIGCDGLLRLLRGRRGQARAARFEAVVAYVERPGSLRLFRGRIDGQIVHARWGRNGFGFDPVFRPDGARQTFAQMPPAEKNLLSHRGRALLQLGDFLARRERPKKRVKGVEPVRQNRIPWPKP